MDTSGWDEKWWDLNMFSRESRTCVGLHRWTVPSRMRRGGREETCSGGQGIAMRPLDLR